MWFHTIQYEFNTVTTTTYYYLQKKTLELRQVGDSEGLAARLVIGCAARKPLSANHRTLAEV